jgi:hypothetical protein
MKKTVLGIFLILSNILNAQVTKSLGEFSKVTAFDKITVILIPSSENKIEISGDLASDVEVVTKNNELKIKMPIDKLMKGGNIKAKVYFEKLEGIEANEGSIVSCNKPLESLDFSLIAKEGGQITANIISERINVKCTNGAIIKLEGDTKNLNIMVNSGGDIDAENCSASQTIVSVNAGGNANVTATDLVDAKVRAGGNITIFGDPRQINQKTVLGGKIIINKN